MPKSRILILCLTLAVAAFAAGNRLNGDTCSPCSGVDVSSIAGVWNAVSTDDNGAQNTIVLTIKDEGGNLSGTLEIKDVGLTLPLVEPKLDGNRFVFQIYINDEPYKVETTIDGSKIEGTFAGPEARGTVKGSKAS